MNEVGLFRWSTTKRRITNAVKELHERIDVAAATEIKVIGPKLQRRATKLTRHLISLPARWGSLAGIATRMGVDDE